MIDLLQTASAALYYMVLLLGSVSLGYLIIRLSFPDVRLLQKEEKTGLAAMSGALTVIAALLLDFLVSGQDKFLAGKGLAPIIIAGMLSLSFLSLKTWFNFIKPSVLVIGVPNKPKRRDELKGLIDEIKPNANDTQSSATQQKTEQNQLNETTHSASIQKPAAFQTLSETPASTPARKPLNESNLKNPVQMTTVQNDNDFAAPKKLFESAKTTTSKTTEKIGVKSNEPQPTEEYLPSKEALNEITFKEKENTQPKEIVQETQPPHGWVADIAKSIGSVFKPKESFDKTQQQEALQDIKKMHAPAVLSVQEDVGRKKAEEKRLKDSELDLMIDDVVKIEPGIGANAGNDQARRRYMQKQVEQMTPRNAKEIQEQQQQAATATNERRYQQQAVVENAKEMHEQVQAADKNATTQEKIMNVPPKTGAVKASDADELLNEMKQEKTTRSQQPAQAEESKSLFTDLSNISSGEKRESDVTFVKAEGPGACPRCKAKNSRIVFCPYCGSAMCANCTPQLTPKDDGFEYVCPNCLEAVFIKKKLVAKTPASQ